MANEPFYVAIITPVIHYCMGGLEITAESEVRFLVAVFVIYIFLEEEEENPLTSPFLYCSFLSLLRLLEPMERESTDCMPQGK